MRKGRVLIVMRSMRKKKVNGGGLIDEIDSRSNRQTDRTDVDDLRNTQTNGIQNM